VAVAVRWSCLETYTPLAPYDVVGALGGGVVQCTDAVTVERVARALLVFHKLLHLGIVDGTSVSASTPHAPGRTYDVWELTGRHTHEREV
jgi:hypothetical protein